MLETHLLQALAALTHEAVWALYVQSWLVRNGPAAEARASRTAQVAAPPKSIALIPLHGVLTSRSSSSWFGETRGMDVLGQAIQAAGDSADIGTIILSIDSPGGTVAGTPELAAIVRAVAARKKVIAIADTLTASASYWIGSQASEFIVAPSAEVGSIGVMSVHQDVSQAMAEMGIVTTMIHAGKYKVEGNPFQPLSEEAKAARQAGVDTAYAAFIADVARGRGVAPAAVRDGFGEGRTVPAAQAVALGMADRIATLDELLAGLTGGTSRMRPRRRSALAF